MVTAKALEPLERVNNANVKVEASAGSASAASGGKENSAGWKSGDRKDHARTSSLSNLDNLLEGEEARDASRRDHDSDEVAGMPDKVYSNDDDLADYSPRPQSARQPHSSKEVRYPRGKVSLERYSTSILDMPPQKKSVRDVALEPIHAGESLREKEIEEAEAEAEGTSSTFESYVVSEFGVHVKPFSDQEGILDLDERERVYNTLIYVPLQYERMLLFGLLLCLDSFLAVFTLMPVRAAYLGYLKMCDLYKKDSVSLLSLLRKVSQHRLPKKKGEGKKAAAKKEGDKEAFVQALPDYLCDVLWVGLILLSCYVLLQWKTSEAFHYIHAQEVIKLYVVLTMLEIFDKICGSLSFDCLETLAASCSMLLGGRSSRGGQEYPAGSKGGRADATRVVVDFFVTLLVMCLHCLIIMLEAVAFNVVLNSASSSLLALLVSNNFAELKGTVFKNMNVTRLWTLSMQDIVEHFHISICLIFVLIENMLLTNAYLPSYQLSFQCAMVLGTEIVVDIMKHAFVGKFQNLKPGVYSEYLKDMCEKTVASSSINGYRIVKFNPLVPASILLRIVVPLWGRSWSRCGSVWAKGTFLVGAGMIWVGLVVFKVVLGWGLQLIARGFLKYYATTRKTKPRPWLLSSRAKKEN